MIKITFKTKPIILKKIEKEINKKKKRMKKITSDNYIKRVVANAIINQ